MKLATAVMMGVSTQRLNERRFSQLQAMMNQHNPNFNIYKHFAYGCNCNLLGADRPLTQPGWGQAVDSVDTVCKQYKDCQRCAEVRHGSDCIGESVSYNYSWGANWNGAKALCHDAAGTCGRALCECDSVFAYNHADATDAEYNMNYSHFYKPFDYENICPNLCHLKSVGVGNTEQYAENSNLNGEYTEKTNLVNDYKCYVSGNNQIVHEHNVFGGQAWVIYEGDTPVFYGATDTVCPRDVEWKHLPDGFNTTLNDVVSSEFIPTDNISSEYSPLEYIQSESIPSEFIPSEILFPLGVNKGGGNGKSGLDEQCCASNNGPYILYNTYTHMCCADGTTRRIGDLC